MTRNPVFVYACLNSDIFCFRYIEGTPHCIINSKFQASYYLLWLYRSVSFGTGLQPCIRCLVTGLTLKIIRPVVYFLITIIFKYVSYEMTLFQILFQITFLSLTLPTIYVLEQK